MTAAFTWLHLSDLHAGVGDQKWLWPTFKRILYEDLARQFERIGPWDVVVFTGDLAQKAAVTEYAQVEEILAELWGQFKRLGFSPVFLCVPGNHDLVRPPSTSAALILKEWWGRPEIHSKPFDDEANEYKGLIESIFAPFVTWEQRLASKLNIPILQRGVLPGDFSATVESPVGKIGFVGLNSSWLQIDDQAYDRKLSVHPKQLLAVTDNDPTAWTRKHEATFLLTHHPSSWLHPTSLGHWNSEISPPGRFDLHLFGHMHESDATTVAHGGGLSRREIQAASVFGLERTANGFERLHGYSIGRLTIDAWKEFRIWPRRLEEMKGGGNRLVPDTTLSLEEETSSFVLRIGNVDLVSSERQTERLELKEEADVVDIIGGGAQLEEILKKVRYFLPHAPASSNVRRVAQRLASAALVENRAIWLISDWGDGSDGFISSLQDEASKLPTYVLDTSDYVNREEFLSTIRARLGFSFEEMCEALSRVGDAYLILDDVPTLRAVHSDLLDVGGEIEHLVFVMLEYCPKLRVLLRTRHRPINSRLRSVALPPFDEADLRSYVAQHPQGGEKHASEDAIGAIFRYTDGVPARIDAALRELEVITIQELASVNLDLTPTELPSPEVPKAMAEAVAELRQSNEQPQQRAYDLLKALSAFPRGETFERVRRFYGVHPLFLDQVHALRERTLVGVAETTRTLETSKQTAKFLTVPRPVRDFVRAQTSAGEQKMQTERAAEIYFGEKWSQGQLKQDALRRFKDPAASDSELVNASAIIVRLVKESVAGEDERSIVVGLRLAAAYVNALMSGHHFRSIVMIGQDFLQIFPNDDREDLNPIKAEYAASLRMIGKHADARDILISLSKSPGSNDLRQRILLNLALVHEALGEGDDALSVSKTIVEIDRNSFNGLHAQAIILNQETDRTTAEAKLRKLERLCRKREAFIVANNIAFDRANHSKQQAEVEESLDAILANANEGKDFYNGARAIVKKVNSRIARKEEVSRAERIMLLSAYNFGWTERMRATFQQAHEALWKLLERENDIPTLFRLFRHSSLIWQLRGNSEREHEYLRRLAKLAPSIVGGEIVNVDQEIAYYTVRASVALLESDED